MSTQELTEPTQQEFDAYYAVRRFLGTKGSRIRHGLMEPSQTMTDIEKPSDEAFAMYATVRKFLGRKGLQKRYETMSDETKKNIGKTLTESRIEKRRNVAAKKR